MTKVKSSRMKVLWVIMIISICTPVCFCQGTEQLLKSKPDKFPLIHTSLVNSFYKMNSNKLFWFNRGENFHLLRIELKNIIDSSAAAGLEKNKYHYTEIQQNLYRSFDETDTTTAMQWDRMFTDAAIAYSKDIYMGTNISSWVSYDEVSKSYVEPGNQYLLNHLIVSITPGQLRNYFRSIEPLDIEYVTMKDELQTQTKNAFRKLQLSTSLNLYRWVHHFHFEKWIIVNIGAATLRYYEQDSLMLRMRAVVGKPSTKTPRFAAHCNQVILYPYWNVPSSIALNEMLPKFKRDPNQVDNLNMQVLNLKGRLIDHHKLNWRSYSKNYFPFQLRQSTGCDNSLGVIKFDLTSPYSVYLHDTNFKTAFMSGWRYYSHGCIRIEEPIELANRILNNKIDNKYLESCLKDQIPVPLILDHPVPVFVVYMTAETDKDNKIQYYKDIYGLLSR